MLMGLCLADEQVPCIEGTNLSKAGMRNTQQNAEMHIRAQKCASLRSRFLIDFQRYKRVKWTILRPLRDAV
jgi:hypothetical protein